MVKKIFIGLILFVLVFLCLAALQPSDFRITRSIEISAPPEAIFQHVNDFHQWEAWSPWAKLDPKAKNFFEGPESGKGAIFAWAGNHEVGEGKMTILETNPNSFIQIKLDFVKPFVATNTAEFTFVPQVNGTLVTWTMYGKNNFIAKVIGLFVDCDKMVGNMFDKGLIRMKEVVESKKS